MKTAEAQVAAMARDWPDFRLTGRAGGRLTWKGPLRPFAVEYVIEVVVQTPRSGRRFSAGDPPRVVVLSPVLARRPAAPEELIPHIYKNDDDPEHPHLCLFDPVANEWNHHYLVAHTLIPWSIQWLTCYEIWRATGEWVGGGRHPSLPTKTEPEVADARA